MLKGYTGNILMVDLSHGTISNIEMGEKFYRKYIGGSAMGLYFLLRDCPPQADPLGAENVLILSTGPLAGSTVPGNSRLCATAKSPLTGMAGDSQIGGYIAKELKYAGFDAIVIKGCSPKPVFLWVNNGKAELKEANSLWGKDTIETEDLIKQEIGDQRAQILEIGMAGERLSRIASIMHQGSRAFGRNGLGAVMGSKKLKAIAVRGSKKPDFADQESLKLLARYGSEKAKTDPIIVDLRINGSNGSLESINAAGGLPTRNYNEGRFEGAKNLYASQITETILLGRETCFACPVSCKRVVEIKEGKFPVDPRYGGAEYESVAALGAFCGVGDVAAVHLANQLCNSYGLDTISTGATIAFAMECFENGLITPEQTDGIALKFGNPDALIEMVRKIGMREGLGDLLAEGSQRAAEKIGPGSFKYLTTVKGQELPAHMPLLKKSLGVIYAVNPFGADHESSEHDPSYEDGAGSPFLDRMGQLGLHDPPPPGSLDAEKVRMVVFTQRYFSLLDTIPLCHFCFAMWTMYDPNHVADIVKAATGWDTNLFELMLVGEKRINMLRAFNARDGATKKADNLPEKLFKPLRGEGPLSGTAVNAGEWEEAIKLYYKISGWDAQTGNPTEAKYAELGLSWIGSHDHKKQLSL